MKEFPCTSCGACCRLVRGNAFRLFSKWGWVQSDGSCKNYSKADKRCMIYEDRPDVCRAATQKPPGVTLDQWYEKVEEDCDQVHKIVYKTERERGTDCMHEEEQSLEIQLETTSTCNARCHFCVYPEVKRWGGLMSMDLFRKIVDETVDIRIIDKFVLHGLGESALDPMMEERIRYISIMKPNARVEIYTNGVYMSPALFDRLKDAGLTSIVFSLNAVDEEQHEKIMGLKGKFDQTCENIDYAIANAGDVNLQVHAVLNEDTFNDYHKMRFYDRWGVRDQGGVGMVIWEGNWAGDNRTTYEFKPNEACARALGQIYVTYDGTVTACCFDPTGKLTFGNLAKQTIREVYNSERFLRFREAHAEDKADMYDLCANCTRI